MLTIKSPIKVTAASSIISLDDRLGKKMQANYQVLASTLSPEHMLHHMRENADIYVEGNSMTSIVNVNQQMNRQKINMELINNVLNRILVAEKQNLCYQDRTFIDMVLNRIGVTDVKQFMNTVVRMKEQTNQISQLLALYEQSGTVLKKITQHNEQKGTAKESGENQMQEKMQKNQDSWLYQNIFQRLQTDIIYQELEKYYGAMYHSHHYIDEREFEMSEQVLLARNLLLKQLKNESLQEEIRLEHKAFHQNTTEQEELYEIKRNDMTLIEHQENIDGRQSHVTENVYKDSKTELIQMNKQDNEETNVLDYRIINSYELGDMNQYEENHELIQNDFIQAVLWNTIKNVITIRMSEINKKEKVWYDIAHNMQYTVENTMNRFENYHKKPFISQQEADYYQTVIMAYDNNQIEKIQNFLAEYQEVEVETGQTFLMQELIHREKNEAKEEEGEPQESENIKEQLQLINQVNIEKQEKLAEIVQEIKREPKLVINKAKAFADAKRIIEHPQEAVMEYLQNDTIVEHFEKERIHQLEQVMDKDIVKIFEQVEQYHKNPQQLSSQVLVNEEALVYFMQESDRTEEVLEEMQTLHRNHTKNIQNHVQDIIQNEDVYQKTVTNKVNYMQLQESEELTNMIANNVKEQLGSISEQVYRKLEKRMDSEKRRRGL